MWCVWGKPGGESVSFRATQSDERGENQPLSYIWTQLGLRIRGPLTPWTMKSSQGPVRALIGCWSRPGITSVYTKGKNVRVTMEIEVRETHILRLT